MAATQPLWTEICLHRSKCRHLRSLQTTGLTAAPSSSLVVAVVIRDAVGRLGAAEPDAALSHLSLAVWL